MARLGNRKMRQKWEIEEQAHELKRQVRVAQYRLLGSPDADAAASEVAALNALLWVLGRRDSIS